MLINKCFKCDKYLWPWQSESNINIVGNIHSTCHAKALEKYMNGGDNMRMRLMNEISRFEKDAGQKCNLKLGEPK